MDSFFTWLASLFKPKQTALVAEIKNAKFYSKRVWLMVAAIIGAICFPSYFNQLGWQLTVLASVFMICDTWTAGKTIDANAALRLSHQAALLDEEPATTAQPSAAPK